jgi:hypothetical protein
VFVREGVDVPKGNVELKKLGAIPLGASELVSIDSLPDWMRAHATPKLVEHDLFGPTLREAPRKER